MNQERRGIIFADDNQETLQKDFNFQFNQFERLLKNEIAISRDVICCISEIDRADKLKEKSKIALSTLNEISKIERKTAKIKYNNLIEGLQIELDTHAELLEINLQRCKYEIKEKITKENNEFDFYMKRSQLFDEILKDEKNHLDLMQRIIDEYKDDFKYENRSKLQLFLDAKRKIIESITAMNIV